jgi:hypothetical protein
MPRHKDTPPTITTLSPLIISSSDKLFFISTKIGTADCRKWRFVRVAFEDSVALYRSCLQDGRFLVDFYMSHSANVRYNAINQCFWLQYCNRNTPTFGNLDAHLITPSDTSADCAARLHLIPVRAWLISIMAIPTSMGHLTLLSSTAENPVIASDRRLGTR